MTTQSLDLLHLVHRQVQIKSPIRLVNTYRGMPVVYPAEVIAINASTLSLKAHQYQSVCLELNRKTYLKLEQPPLISADVVSGDIIQQTFTLSNLALSSEQIGNREITRVKPKSPLPVVLTKTSNQLKIAAEMIDISVSGIGVYGLSVSLAEIREFTTGRSVRVRLIIPKEDLGAASNQEVEVMGQVCNVIPSQDTHRFRLGIRISPEPDVQALISSYVSQRQLEIITELRRLYRTLVQLSKD